MKKINTNSNLYIVVYSTVMVVVVALVLAVAALSLQERQYANELGEKKQSILASLSAADENYDEFIAARVLNANGDTVEGGDVFAMLNDLQGSFDKGRFPVFEAKDGRVVIPVTGSGLWGPIWGYVALENDMNTVAGIVMAHKGETPGLGAEIATPPIRPSMWVRPSSRATTSCRSRSRKAAPIPPTPTMLTKWMPSRAAPRRATASRR